MTTNTEALLRGASRENDAHDEAKADRYCDMGVGCGAYGACYAAANGEPERCPRTPHHAQTQPAPAASVSVPTTEDEAAAMQMIGYAWLRDNAPHRLTQPAASVSDEQIAACVKRASTYGLPFVGLLNPGGTPSDFSKRFTAEILALRPDQETPEQKDQSAWCEYVAGMVFGWLQMQRELPNEELCIKAIAGIIERRMWVLRPAQAGVQDDSALIDWLCQQVVEVRIPLRYGSQQCFIGSPDDNDSESVPWDIRAAIRRAMLAAAPKEGAKK